VYAELHARALRVARLALWRLPLTVGRVDLSIMCVCTMCAVSFNRRCMPCSVLSGSFFR